ncbi:MAG: YcaO-like family protein [Kineosporiaceae bacterium]
MTSWGPLEVRAAGPGTAVVVGDDGGIRRIDAAADDLVGAGGAAALTAADPSLAGGARTRVRVLGAPDVVGPLPEFLRLPPWTGDGDREDGCDAEQVTIEVVDHLAADLVEALDRRVAADAPGSAVIVAVWPHLGRCWSATADPDRGVWLSDAVDRLRAALPSADLADALTRAPVQASVGTLVGLRAVVTALVVEAWHDPGLLRHRGVLRRWDGPDRREHVLLPRPSPRPWTPHPAVGAPANRRSAAPRRPGLVDEVTGVVRRVTTRPPLPGMPPGFRHDHAELPRLVHIDPDWRPDPLAPAARLVVPPATEPPAGHHSTEVLAAGVAHYCGAYLGQGTRVRATWSALTGSGEDAVDPIDLTLHDPAIPGSPGSPLVPFDRDTDVWWLQGTRCRDGRPCWVPLSLVHAGWLEVTALGPQPVTNYHNLTGLAAALDPVSALDRALEHVVAQDAVAAWWHRGPELARLPVPGDVAAAWAGPAVDVRLTLLDVPGTTGLPVVLAVADDLARGIATLGHASGRSSRVAARRAAAEALLQHAYARDLDDPDGLVRRAGALGNGVVGGLAPHCPGREYLAAHRPDLRDLVDPMCHVEVGLDPAVTGTTRRRVRPEGTAQHRLAPAPVVDTVLAAGWEPAAVDVTADDVRACGWSAVRVVVPGMQPLLPAAFPPAPRRLDAVAEALGWPDPPSPPGPYPGW